MAIPIKDFSKLMSSLAQVVRDNSGACLFNAGNLAAALMEKRVFNHGRTIDGTTLRYRSDQYKRRRQRRGRQIEYKDFQFTDNLFNSLTVLQSDNNKFVYGFSSHETAQVAFNVTDQIGLKVSDVWGLSEEEKTAALKNYESCLTAKMNEAVRAFPGKPSKATKEKSIKKGSVKAYSSLKTKSKSKPRKVRDSQK